MKKVEKTNYGYNWKILRMPFSNILKTQKLLQNQEFKNSKSCVRRPQIKKFRKQIIVRIEEY